MKKLLLFISIFLVIACTSSKPALIYQSAEGTPREWLEKEYGDAPFVNTLNFYIENSPWSSEYQRAISITSDKVYLVVIEKNEDYQFFHYEIYFSACKDLEESVKNLKDKLNSYKKDPSLVQKEAIIWLDGPDYTLESFGDIAYKSGNYEVPNLWGYGNVIDFVYDVLKSAENCSSQLTNRGSRRINS